MGTLDSIKWESEQASRDYHRTLYERKLHREERCDLWCRFCAEERHYGKKKDTPMEHFIRNLDFWRA